MVVTEGSSAPVSGAPILIRSSSESRSTITDESGRFRFAALPPGDYRLTVTGGGPRPTRVTVSLARTVSVLLTSSLRRPAPEASVANTFTGYR